MKYSVKKGGERLMLKMFKESLASQINEILPSALKDDEWLIESLGMNTFINNNLLPTPERSIKIKDIYEAFLRFDDKELITGPEAIQKGILARLKEGKFCMAQGDGVQFTTFYCKETEPIFDVNDESYWLVDESLKPKPVEGKTGGVGENGGSNNGKGETGGGEKKTDEKGEAPKQFKSIAISGKVPLERYTELFNYFIAPYAMSGNKIEIEVKFTIQAVKDSPMYENNQQYKSAKEAAKQLGLKFESEPV
jgi:hypothetical protein